MSLKMDSNATDSDKKIITLVVKGPQSILKEQVEDEAFFGQTWSQFLTERRGLKLPMDGSVVIRTIHSPNVVTKRGKSGKKGGGWTAELNEKIGEFVKKYDRKNLKKHSVRLAYRRSIKELINNMATLPVSREASTATILTGGGSGVTEVTEGGPKGYTLRSLRRGTNQKEKAAPSQQETARGQKKTARGQKKSARGQKKSARGQKKSARGQKKSAHGQNKTARMPKKSKRVQKKTAREQEKNDEKEIEEPEDLKCFRYVQVDKIDLMDHPGETSEGNTEGEEEAFYSDPIDHEIDINTERLAGDASVDACMEQHADQNVVGDNGGRIQDELMLDARATVKVEQE